MRDYKKYIFDVDYTILIPDWSREDDYFKKCIKEEEQDKFFASKQDILNKYEQIFPKYDTKTLSEFFKKYDLNITEDAINGWIIHNGESIEDVVRDSTKELFEYLKNNGKEIVILTNWFSGTQIQRLKRAGLFPYIDKIIAGEDAVKPGIKSFELAIGETNKEDCLMIGDSITSDRMGTINAGIDFYLVDKNHTILDLYSLVTENKKMINKL